MNRFLSFGSSATTRVAHRAGTRPSVAYAHWTTFIVALALVFASSNAQAQIPVHYHGTGFTSWERDGDIGAGPVAHDHTTGITGEEGDTAHQHYMAESFHGGANGAVPFSFYGAWLDRTATVETTASFDTNATYTASHVGHGWINPLTRPRYRFDGAAWTTDATAMAAKAVIQAAFGNYGLIHADYSLATGVGMQTGFGFSFTTGGTSEILVQWNNFAAASGCGSTTVPDGTHTSASPVLLEFDSNARCDYDMNIGAAASDLSKWHLYSVALHEIGHLTFQEHVAGRDTHIMAPSVGAPLGANVGDLSYRWDSLIDNPGENDYFQGTRYTRNNLGGADTLTIQDIDIVRGVKSMYSIPVPEPGSIMLIGIGMGGSFVALRRRKK
jgi:hypothetical protein